MEPKLITPKDYWGLGFGAGLFAMMAITKVIAQQWDLAVGAAIMVVCFYMMMRHMEQQSLRGHLPPEPWYKFRLW